VEDRSLPIRAAVFLKWALAQLLFRVKRALGLVAQSVQQDQLHELAHETRVLGSASAESINHVGAELREINERLTKLEGDVERIARLLEEGAGNGPAPESKAAAQSLTTD
jgi:hypothetical protein